MIPEYTDSDWLPAGLHAVAYHPLRPAAKLVSSLPHCVLTSAVFYQLVCEDVMGDSVRSPAKTVRNNIHCFSFIPQASHLILEGYQVGEAGISLSYIQSLSCP